MLAISTINTGAYILYNIYKVIYSNSYVIFFDRDWICILKVFYEYVF